MGWIGESATAVPGPQWPISPLIRAASGQALWSRGRTLRGFRNTALGLFSLCCALCSPHSALAQNAPEVTPPATAAAAEGWSRRLARSHFERALILEQRGDIAQALREYTEAIAIDSTLGDAYAHLGSLRERMGDAREAELVYSEGLRLGDSRAQTLLARSHLHRAAGRSSQALADLEASVELDPTRPALEELARDYVEAHAFSAALATFRRILSLAQNSGDSSAIETARLEVRALRVLAAETDPSTQRAKRHDWVGRALISISRR